MQIKSIKIEIDGKEHELNLEQAQKLRQLLDGILGAKVQYPPVVVPFAQVIDACNDGGPHDYPSHQVGIVSCKKCGRVSGNQITWTTTTGGTSGTGAGDYFYVNAKKENQS